MSHPVSPPEAALPDTRNPAGEAPRGVEPGVKPAGSLPRLVFLWENFGPMHADRCDAVAAEVRGEAEVVGLELYGQSDTYDWVPETGEGFRKVTLHPASRPTGLALLRSLAAFRRREGRAIWFMCHYSWMPVFAFACLLRLRGDRVYTMGCSKFDDMPRRPFREWVKSWFLKPYQGAIGSGFRTRDYFRFLGIPEKRITGVYNTVSLDRIRRMSEGQPAPEGIPFGERHFTIVARLVPKKNLFVALEAYALYAAADPAPRPLHLCGSGPLEAELRARAEALGIAERVIFHGFLQTDAIARLLTSTLALVLTSTEEQFGNVVIEAQAMGVPSILSDICGARDSLVRTGVNGFVVEPDNPEGFAFFMRLLATDRDLWEHQCRGAADYAPRGDVPAFAAGVRELMK